MTKLFIYTVVTSETSVNPSTFKSVIISSKNSNLFITYCIFFNGVQGFQYPLHSDHNCTSCNFQFYDLEDRVPLTSICTIVSRLSSTHDYVTRLDNGDTLDPYFFYYFKKSACLDVHLYIPSYNIYYNSEFDHCLNARSVCWHSKDRLLSEFHGAGIIISQHLLDKAYDFHPLQDRQDGYTLWINTLSSKFAFVESCFYNYFKEEHSLSSSTLSNIKARFYSLIHLADCIRGLRIKIVTIYPSSNSVQSDILNCNLPVYLDQLLEFLSGFGSIPSIVLLGRGELDGVFSKYQKSLTASLQTSIPFLLRTNPFIIDSDYILYFNPKYPFTSFEEAVNCLLQTIYTASNCGVTITPSHSITLNAFGDSLELSRDYYFKRIQATRQSGLIALRTSFIKSSESNFLLDPSSCTLCLGSDLGQLYIPDKITFHKFLDHIKCIPQHL